MSDKDTQVVDEITEAEFKTLKTEAGLYRRAKEKGLFDVSSDDDVVPGWCMLRAGAGRWALSLERKERMMILCGKSTASMTS